MRKLVDENLPNLHILCTSRDELDIRDALQDVSRVTVQLDHGEVDADIRKYIESCLGHSRLLNLPSPLKDEIILKVGDGAHGMYVVTESTQGRD